MRTDLCVDAQSKGCQMAVALVVALTGDGHLGHLDPLHTFLESQIHDENTMQIL